MNIVPEYVTRGLYPNFDDYVEALYLDYFNNYLTVEKFANDYDFNIELANKIINKGRELNDYRVKNLKELIEIFTIQFNHRLDFASWNQKDFIQFVEDFIDGKTEYYCSDVFMMESYNRVIVLLNRLNGRS